MKRFSRVFFLFRKLTSKRNNRRESRTPKSEELALRLHSVGPLALARHEGVHERGSGDKYVAIHSFATLHASKSSGSGDMYVAIHSFATLHASKSSCSSIILLFIMKEAYDNSVRVAVDTQLPPSFSLRLTFLCYCTYSPGGTTSIPGRMGASRLSSE